MRLGKVSENVLKRSILKRCRSKNSEVAQGPAIGQDCAIGRLRGYEEEAVHTQTAVYVQKGCLRNAVYTGVNNLFCAGAVPAGITAAIMIPQTKEDRDNRDETLLRAMIDEIDGACRELGIALAGGHTEVSCFVNRPLAVLTAFGLSGSRCRRTSEIREGLELVMAGYPALTGTAMLARAKESELKKRFPLEMVETAMEFDRGLSLERITEIGRELQAAAMHDIAEGGVFGALWEFCESSETGMEADLRKIPIRQETIEICELYGWNPYLLYSGGSVLIAAEDGQLLTDRLRAEGFTAEVIGRTTGKREKVLKNGEESRFLDKPDQDELWKLFEEM